MIFPDFRPSKAHPEARANRKAFEKESPHFNMNEFGMKAGALALLTAVALFPWEKEHEKHQRTHHPERFEDEKDSKGKGRRGSARDGDGGRRGRDADRDGGRRRRRQSEGGEREREYRAYLNRDREYGVIRNGDGLPPRVGGNVRGFEGERTYTGSDDGDYGRRYIEASRRERERRERGSGDYGRRRSVDYDYRRSSGDERRR